MADTDLLSLPSHFDSDAAFDFGMDFDELDCVDPLNMSGRCDLHKGIRIELTEQPHSMRQVANIVIALHRLKNIHKTQSADLTHQKLFNVIIENVVEECKVMEMYRDSSKTYQMQERTVQCTICDHSQKNLVKPKGSSVLLSVTLKAGNWDHQVWFNLSPYTPPYSKDTRGLPVCLGIVKSNLYLSCRNDDKGVPSLFLEEVKDRQTLRTIKEDDDMERFLFYRNGSGESINTFESVKYPGWFISTSQNDMKQVDMCKEKVDCDRVHAFLLHDQKVVFENQL
ncbi:interleukin-1 beta [Trichomycterus rosablanca]|uniref:interleukin-1 beta n=1 Tax=Trichomycterus rosablanca TaxID=2290929 RepID=UPI002F360B72